MSHKETRAVREQVSFGIGSGRHQHEQRDTRVLVCFSRLCSRSPGRCGGGPLISQYRTCFSPPLSLLLLLLLPHSHPYEKVYNENKPRLAVSGWFHGALPSEMRDWPEHVPNGQGSNGGREDASSGGEETTASTLEQLKGKVGGAERSGPDDGSPGAFEDDFSGTEVRGKDSHSHSIHYTRERFAIVEGVGVCSPTGVISALNSVSVFGEL